MIIEDEPRILRDLKKLVEGDQSTFYVSHAFTNGQQAMAILDSVSPDILITDIQMPVVDGLDLIHYIRQKKLNTIPIILTGYREFEYAKRALNLGVNHYLLKPIDNKELQTLLHDLKRLIDKQRNTNQRECYNALIEGQSLNHLVPYSHPDIAMSHFMLLLCAGSFPSFSVTHDPVKLVFWNSINLEDILAPFLKQGETVFSFNGQSTSEQIVLLSLLEPSLEAYSHLTQVLLNKLSQSNYSITVIMGENIGHLSELHLLMQKYRQFLNKYLLYGTSQILQLTNPPNTLYLQRENTNRNRIEQMLLSLKQGHFSQYHKVLTSSLNEFVEHPISQMDLTVFLNDLMAQTLFQLGINSRDMIAEKNLEIAELVSTTHTITDLINNLTPIINDLFQQTLGNTLDDINCTNELLIQKIDKYIQLHLAEQINQQVLSERFGLVPSYLSKLFRRYMVLSPTEYIVTLRVEKAKELIYTNPSILAKDVAQLVGYSDPLYFSKIFKKTTGISISEFKSNVDNR